MSRLPLLALSLVFLACAASAQASNQSLQAAINQVAGVYPDDTADVHVTMNDGTVSYFTVITSGGKVASIAKGSPASPTLRVITTQATLEWIASSADPWKAALTAMNTGAIQVISLNFVNQIKSFFLGLSVWSFNLFGGAGAPAQSQAPSKLCPIGCFLYYSSAGMAGIIDVNCNVDSASVHKALQTCPGKQSYVTVQNVPCECKPVEVTSTPCPYACGNPQCNVNPTVAGKGNVPCDGVAQGTNANCKCILVNGQWDLGAKYGIK